MFHQRNHNQDVMISVLEQPSVRARLQHDGEPEARNTATGNTCLVNGVRLNHVAISEPPIVDTRELDRWDMIRLANGDEQALGSLMQRHGKKLLRHLERMVRNHSDAKELVNETFIRVFQHRRDFNFELRFTTWLYVISSHLAINLLRWRARRPELVPLPTVAEENSATTSNALIDPTPTPREQAESDEWTDALEQALARMPAQLREPLLLVSLDGFSQAEVAARLGCTVKAVETRLYHGRKRLRQMLDGIFNPWRVRVAAAMQLQGKPCQYSIHCVPRGKPLSAAYGTITKEGDA
jgi:RNA polymerase sigma-70 factor (ECF subfamily)